jgi:sortase A
MNYRLLFTGQVALATMGVLLLGYCGIVSFGAKAFQTQAAPAYSYSSGNFARTSPIEGTALARLTIPDLKLDLIVIEGVSSKDLSVAPGHIPGTSLPGHAGNVGIAGHRDTVFRKLRSARLNELITLTTARGEIRYRVVSLEVVSPSDVRVLHPTSRDSLTLVTCYPFNFIGSAPNRFIVRAERVMTRPSPHEDPNY